MDNYYRQESTSDKRVWLLIAPLFIILIAGGVFLFFKNQKKMVSPVPPQPAFEVIFYTPTPGITTLTSTPSATPKVKKTPTVTPKITEKLTPSPTGKTSTTSPTPTKKPTNTPTVTPKA